MNIPGTVCVYSYPLKQNPVGTFKVRLTRNDFGDFDFYINGTKVNPIPIPGMNSIYPSDDKAYLAMGASGNTGRPSQFTILKVNGKSVVNTPAKDYVTAKDTSK